MAVQDKTGLDIPVLREHHHFLSRSLIISADRFFFNNNSKKKFFLDHVRDKSAVANFKKIFLRISAPVKIRL